MPKGDFMTPKAIGNRMKSVGLQRLRWYCQMCEKQCRDENGFKCHTSSEGHLRQMKLFSEKSDSIIDGFSSDFESGFVDTLSHLHGTKRVLANKVYQEYIQDKNHIHMNSTMWTSLTGFLMYLGREGKAVVDETERGWFVQYIDRDPKALARQQMRDQREQTDLDDQQRSDRLIRVQIEAAEARRLKEGGDENKDDEIDETEKLFKKQPVEVAWKTIETKKRKVNAFQTEEEEDDDNNNSDSAPLKLGSSHAPPTSSSSSSSHHHRHQPSEVSSLGSRGGYSQLEIMMREEESRKRWRIEQDDRKDRRDNWLTVGLIVKIMNEKVGGGKYYKRKGEVMRVIDTYVGEVSVDGAILRIDQEHLETVIPKEGETVRVVNGRGRGLLAKLLRIHESKYCCDIRIKRFHGEGSGGGGNATGVMSAQQFYSDMELSVEYEDICKVA